MGINSTDDNLDFNEWTGEPVSPAPKQLVAEKDEEKVVKEKQIDTTIIPQEAPTIDIMDAFITGLSANPDDIENAKTITLIDGFMEYNTVGILYGESGSGKSMLMLSVCVYLLENTIIDKVNYFDFDNGKADQKNRGIHLLLRKYGNRFNYINLDTIDSADLTPPQILNKLIDAPVKGSTPYERQFFVFDTMGELAEGSLGKDDVMRPLLDKFKKLRSMGATMQTIHHNTKSKEDVSFFGSNYIKIKIDALWHLTAKESENKGKMEFALNMQKNRSGNLKDSAFIIDPVTHTLEGGDYAIASMNEDDTFFVASIRGILAGCEMINQGELLTAIDKKKDDRTALKQLQKYDGVFWKSERLANKNNSLMYSESKHT
ncbi:AAA family ATPase [Sulfurovum sp. CS9]|uniref:AAA family ATPase n=1 Tax=Sulfurovum sp. CS9 TaxID=3391146 RepID=UPI0039E92751